MANLMDIILNLFILGKYSMQYFIFRACWSQTDQDIYIIKAHDKKDAEYRIKKSPLNPHHWEYMGQTRNPILE